MTLGVEQHAADLLRDWAGLHLTRWASKRVDAFGSGEIEVRVKDEGAFAETLVLRLVFSHARRQTYLTNIMMPRPLTHRGLGKALISSIFRITNEAGYPLFVVDLVPGFYNRLVQRGADVVVEDDVVLITEQTDLAHRHD